MFAAPQYGFIKLLHLVHMNDIIDINNIINMIIDINNIINMIIDINKVSTQKTSSKPRRRARTEIAGDSLTH